jgi:hypothetical protein
MERRAGCVTPETGGRRLSNPVAGISDRTRFTVKLALRVIGDRYNDEIVRLILSLNDNGGTTH